MNYLDKIQGKNQSFLAKIQGKIQYILDKFQRYICVSVANRKKFLADIANHADCIPEWNAFICVILRDQREIYLDIHLIELHLIIKNIRH